MLTTMMLWTAAVALGIAVLFGLLYVLHVPFPIKLDEGYASDYRLWGAHAIGLAVTSAVLWLSANSQMIYNTLST